MVDPARQLADLTKIVLDTSNVLSTKAGELLDRLIDQLPPDEEPSPLTVDASDDTTDETGMTVLLAWDNSGSGNSVTIDWGAVDAVDDDEEPATGTATFRYADAGQYTITVTDLEDETRTASADVEVPFGGRELVVAAVESTADTTRMTVDVTVDNHGSGAATLNFGDGTPTGTNPGDGVTVTAHQYVTAGTFTVTATDDDDPTRTAATDVTVPFTGAARRRR